MNQQLLDTTNVLIDVRLERERQDGLWGEQNHNTADWALILGEEHGEVMKAATEERFAPVHGEDDRTYTELLKEWRARRAKLREELVHEAAVAVAWIECIDRNEGRPPR